MTIDTEHFKEKLLAEKAVLEKQLGRVAHQISADGDWAADIPEPDESEQDPNTQADRIEEFETNIATMNVIESRYRDVLDALIRIQKGTYGICEDTGKQISIERLNANPSARNTVVQ